ncbi:uncharacterized protein BO88DRAFT_401685 [Aspergillus vadensis CBS 113365]|uniref:Uncharacterized protein n=1 Tax=Aspergillus vadensis (strain CBS 113365 / IMI 142717 / IBT 24658) TaxID=1448311 RepID=A0A319BKY3_ASPVC|nr:hypothetical protein BO88DRAFT_401685 [Aspergillus vadensis CBS 113365]PYH72549.1 hypothetical protein BO88DRAFT_401685 [Aspergillus vadensis CBS 113365]
MVLTNTTLVFINPAADKNCIVIRYVALQEYSTYRLLKTSPMKSMISYLVLRSNQLTIFSIDYILPVILVLSYFPVSQP